MLRLVLRHAWLSLWDKHMTTGRINQVAIVRPRGLPPKNFHVARRREATCSYADVFRKLLISYRTPGRTRRSWKRVRWFPGRAGQAAPGLPNASPVVTSLAVDKRPVASFRRTAVSKEAGTRSPGSAPPNIPLRESTTQDRQVSNVVRHDRRDPRDHTHLWTALQDFTQRHRHSRAVASSPLDPTYPSGRTRVNMPCHQRVCLGQEMRHRSE